MAAGTVRPFGPSTPFCIAELRFQWRCRGRGFQTARAGARGEGGGGFWDWDGTVRLSGMIAA